MKELVVVAIGGNSIIKDNASQSIAHQEQAVQEVAAHISDMVAEGYNIVLTHGNGPQVGLDLRRAEIAHVQEGLPLTPLANCVADTQGGIGYLIQQALTNKLRVQQNKQAITLITQVEVDKNDPNFASPTKPIGAFFSEQERVQLKQENPQWHFVEDSGRGYRRVVASPIPQHVIESKAIKSLSECGYVVIAVGGVVYPLSKMKMAITKVLMRLLIKICHQHCSQKNYMQIFLSLPQVLKKCVFILASQNKKP